jgi:UDP-glucose 4-epimerase
MSVLVTGGAGYIGSHTVLALIDAGFKVIVLDDLSTGLDWLVNPHAKLYVGDCGDRQLVASLISRHDIHTIIHFAGSIVVPDSVVDPLGYYLNNTIKSHALVSCAVEHNVANFIFSSTAAVYGDANVSPIPENTPLAPASPYGSSKMMTEVMLHDASRVHGLKYAVMRYFNVAGADPRARAGQASRWATHLIKVACQTARGERSTLEIYGTDYPTRDGTCVRDYIHVSDLAHAHLAAWQHLQSGGPNLILNCGYGRGYSVLEVLAAVKRVSGVDFRVRHVERRVGDPPELVAQVDGIRDKLRWKPLFDDLDTIVQHALNWEQKLSELEKGAYAPRSETAA